MVPVVIIIFAEINPHTDRFFVDISGKRWMDKTAHTTGDFDNFTNGEFIEVFIHIGALNKRTEYLNSLTNTNNSMHPSHFYFCFLYFYIFIVETCGLIFTS
jgi:hypothetical protein